MTLWVAGILCRRGWYGLSRWWCDRWRIPHWHGIPLYWPGSLEELLP